MDSLKHTPGPWYVDSYRQPIADTGDYDNVTLIRTKAAKRDPVPSWVAEVSDCFDQKANAQLIAAAPTMQTALEEILCWMTNQNLYEPHEIAAKVMNALKESGYDQESLDISAIAMLRGAAHI